MKIAEEQGQHMTELWERDAWELADGVRSGRVCGESMLLDVLPRARRAASIRS